MRLRSILASTIFAAAATVISAGSAFAAATTWNPAAVGLNGTQINGFDNFLVNDYAVITILDGAGNFSETGVLNIKNGFTNGGNPVATPGLGQAGGYSLYYVFNATGNQGGPIPVAPNTTVNGTFSSLNFTLYGVNNGTLGFGLSAAGVSISGNAGAIALATGSLVDGILSLTRLPAIQGGGLSPKADVLVNLDPCLGAGGGCTADESAFFVSPDALTAMLQFGDFSATGSVVTVHGNQVWINGGGGNITSIAVPEPVTLSLFGAGLAGAAALRRRKVKKA